MNINEVENLTGLARANIRYYEKEGLIAVERMDNRYRDYSGENVNDLRKIVLLRRLGLSVDTIRNIIDGRTDMEKELKERLGSISGDMDELLKAKAICEKMLDDHIGFKDLDAMKYTELFDSVKTDVLTKDIPEKGHPWRRFFAVYTDMFFCSMFLEMVFLLVGRNRTITTSLDILFTLMVIAFMFFVEPLFLSLFGTTPGKKIFGIHVYLCGGEKMSYIDGLYRCFYRLKNGLGFYIPIYSIYRLYKSFEACSDNEIMPWDDDYGTEIRLNGHSWKNTAAWAVSIAAVFGLNIFVIIALAFPPNHGYITPEEFAQNYNYSSKYSGYDFYITPEPVDQNSGKFVEDHYPMGSAVITLGPMFSQRQLYYKTDENGYVTETGFVIDGEERFYYNSWENYEYNLMWAFMMGDENVFTYSKTEDFIIDTMDGPFESGIYSYEGYTVKKEVDTSGYKFDDENTIEKDSTDGHFYLKWSISKTDASDI